MTLTVKQLQDRLEELVIKGFAKPETLVNVGVGQNLHPITHLYKDDAPFGNLECVFLVTDPTTTIKRPSLF